MGRNAHREVGRQIDKFRKKNVWKISRKKAGRENCRKRQQERTVGKSSKGKDRRRKLQEKTAREKTGGENCRKRQQGKRQAEGTAGKSSKGMAGDRKSVV